jgi:predicted DsbA family dithiol-disulfide isomerase
MQQVRAMVQNDSTLDDTVASDITMALRDSIHQTPTIIVAHEGQRETVTGVSDYNLLKSHLDRLLAK